jgi:hypothetical protein
MRNENYTYRSFTNSLTERENYWLDGHITVLEKISDRELRDLLKTINNAASVWVETRIKRTTKAAAKNGSSNCKEAA